MFVETFAVGPLQCNCTILGCEATGEAIVVDPGAEPERILEILRAHDLTATALVHTHAHLDHVGATGPVKGAFDGVPDIALHRGDLWLYDNVPMQARMLGLGSVEVPPPPDRWLAHGDTVRWGATGSAEGILRSIEERLSPLDPDTLVVAGHGPSSTIGDERRSNPFLNRA